MTSWKWGGLISTLPGNKCLGSSEVCCRYCCFPSVPLTLPLALWLSSVTKSCPVSKFSSALDPDNLVLWETVSILFVQRALSLWKKKKNHSYSYLPIELEVRGWHILGEKGIERTEKISVCSCQTGNYFMKKVEFYRKCGSALEDSTEHEYI